MEKYRHFTFRLTYDDGRAVTETVDCDDWEPGESVDDQARYLRWYALGSGAVECILVRAWADGVPHA